MRRLIQITVASAIALGLLLLAAEVLDEHHQHKEWLNSYGTREDW